MALRTWLNVVKGTVVQLDRSAHHSLCAHMHTYVLAYVHTYVDRPPLLDDAAM